MRPRFAPAAPRAGRLRTVATTAVVTSLLWIGGIALWLPWRGPATGPVATIALPPPLPSAAAPPVAEGALAVPVAGIVPAQLTDTFAQARAGGARPHDAIDIMAPRGTPVIAAAPGKVEKLFLSKPGGKTIYLRSPDGRLIYYYAHLDAYAPGLAEGQEVAAGAPLGTVGSTGNANPAGPHLHFAILEADPAAPWWQKAPALNPYPWLVSGQRPELGARTQRSEPSLPSGASRFRNERPVSTYASPRSGPEVNSTLSPVIR